MEMAVTEEGQRKIRAWCQKVREKADQKRKDAAEAAHQSREKDYEAIPEGYGAEYARNNRDEIFDDFPTEPPCAYKTTENQMEIDGEYDRRHYLNGSFQGHSRSSESSTHDDGGAKGRYWHSDYSHVLCGGKDPATPQEAVESASSGPTTYNEESNSWQQRKDPPKDRSVWIYTSDSQPADTNDGQFWYNCEGDERTPTEMARITSNQKERANLSHPRSAKRITLMFLKERDQLELDTRGDYVHVQPREDYGVHLVLCRACGRTTNKTLRDCQRCGGKLPNMSSEQVAEASQWIEKQSQEHKLYWKEKTIGPRIASNPVYAVAKEETFFFS